MSEPTRVAVIGAGPGGYAAAFHAADLGMRVSLVDEAPRPGGVCLQRGCMPSKALLHVARVLGEARSASAWGVAFGEPRIDLARLRAWKDGVVDTLTGGLAQLSRQRAVDYVQGRAALVDAHTIRVAGPDGATDTLPFDFAVLATGSRPARPPALAAAGERVLDSTAALELRRVPRTLLVVGGGYIGLELGTVYAALGSAVTVVEMTSGLLPGVDRDLVAVLARRLRECTAAIHLDTKVSELNPVEEGVEVVLDGPDVETPRQVFDTVLVSVGRVPNSRIDGLERTAVALDEQGFVQVDAQRRTAEPSLFAIGDLAGEPLLAHKAMHEGRVAVEAIAGRAAAFEPAAIPAVVFTDPEVAWCGLTEADAVAGGRTIASATFPWGASGRALTLDRPEGVTKLVLDPETERILGVGIAGTGAGELIAEAVLAVERQVTASDLAGAIHPHPTLSETLTEAADAFFGRSVHLPRPRRPA
jgi:dihydrolipoamide dehydrogenase